MIFGDARTYTLAAKEGDGVLYGKSNCQAVLCVRLADVIKGSVDTIIFSL